MFYWDSISEKKDDFRNDALRSIARYDKQDSRLDDYREDYSLKRIDTMKIPKDEILWGTIDEDRTIPVTTKYPLDEKGNRSFSAIIFGTQGDGKTQFLKTILFPQLAKRFGLYVLLFDPKGDYENLDCPMNEPEYIKILRRYGIHASGYKSSAFNPYWLHLEEKERDGTPFNFNLKNFKDLDVSKRESIFRSLLNLKSDEESASMLTSLVLRGDFPPDDIETMREMIIEVQNQTRYSRAMAGGADARPSTKLYSMIDRAVMTGVLGDDETEFSYTDYDMGVVKKKTLPYINFPQELATNKILRLNLDLESDSHMLRVISAMVLGSVWEDRLKRVQSKGRMGYIDAPIVYAIDEADVLCPAYPKRAVSTAQMAQTQTRGRKFGFHSFFITQKPQQINPTIIAGSQFIITTKLTREVLTAISPYYSIPKWQIDDLMNVQYDSKNPTRNQWLLISKDTANPVKAFYALPPDIAIDRESSKV